MRHLFSFLLCSVLLLCVTGSKAQFNPIPVTGFNQDAIAEAGPSSLATTSSAMDAAASNKVMYSQAFRTFAGIGGGGLPDNGLISATGMDFQLANYTGNNALFLFRNETGSLNLVTPASFARIRVLCFATEANVAPANALVNATVFFTDGSSTPYVTNYGLADWFNGSTNTVITGFGRCSRVASAPWGDEAYPTNPRMYYIEITLNCTDIPKQIQRVSFSNVTTAGPNAPFPNEVFMAISGVQYAQTITPTITPCDCNGPNGSIALNVTGSTSPYTYSWNTVPVQTGATATGLAPGTYTCTITDAGGCQTTYTGTVPLNNNAAMTATANPVAICAGSSSTLTANVSSGTLTTLTWNPGALNGSPVTVTPASTALYTVNGSNAVGCTASAQVTVTVNTVPAAPTVNAVTACPGVDALLQVQNPQAGHTYNWYNAATGGALLGSGTSYTVPGSATSSTVYVEATGPGGCISATRTAVTVTVLQQLAQPVVTLTNTTFTSLTFSWTAIPGATGYQVTTNGGASFQTPSSGPLGTTHTITGLTGNTTVIIQVRALGVQACVNSILSAPVSGTTLSSKEIFVPNVFTPNGDGKNDVLLVYGNYVASIQFRIFNQWGELIFISDNINNGWNGVYKGQQQPVGVYAYTLKVVLQDGTIVNKKGSINLIR